jgi:hypothetical protein
VRRVLFLALLAVGGIGFAATPPAVRPAPKFLSPSPDQAEGARLLAGFRGTSLPGAHWLQFQLREMPRRGPERVLRGEMFGLAGPRGPLLRLRVTKQLESPATRWMNFLLVNAPPMRAWTYDDGLHGRNSEEVTAENVLQPVMDTDLTLFDLQMPFLHWTDFVYEGIANVRGRPAHAFLLHPPGETAATFARSRFVAPAAVRVFLDTQFNAVTQAEWVAADGKAVKAVTVLDLKKLGETWVVKSIDLRNLVTRGKTRFELTAAALDLTLAPEVFAPDALAAPPPEIPAAVVRRF